MTELNNSVLEPVDGGFIFNCEGCGIEHVIWTGKSGYPVWQFNGDVVKPTFSPSHLCEYEWGEERKKVRCHSFIKNGVIEYLSDCTHSLAGHNVKMKPMSELE